MRKPEGLEQIEQENKYNNYGKKPAKKPEAKPAAAGGKIPKWKL